MLPLAISLGTAIWVPIALLLTAAGIWLGFLIRRSREGFEREASAPWWVGAGALWLCAAAVFLSTAIGMWPYIWEYHSWNTHEGTVAQISHRLVGDGDGMQQRFVVRFAGSPQQYGCDDTRCSAIHKGDHLTLSCIRDWQYASTSGYNCRFVDYRKG